MPFMGGLRRFLLSLSGGCGPSRPAWFVPGPPPLKCEGNWDEIRRSLRMHERSRSMNGVTIPVTDETFEDEVLNAEQPVLIDYWAEWCGPCKMIAPVLEEIAEDYAGRLKVAKLNIDENPATPPKYGIRGIPTLMLFKNGSVEATKVGAVSKSQLSAFIDSNL